MDKDKNPTKRTSVMLVLASTLPLPEANPTRIRKTAKIARDLRKKALRSETTRTTDMDGNNTLCRPTTSASGPRINTPRNMPRKSQMLRMVPSAAKSI